ncbi:unnamed protein product, partial [Dicrocoelium dendriticum]
MEEDGEVVSNDTAGAEDRAVEPSGTSESHSARQPSVPVPSTTACPINPKKRIISQLSEICGDGDFSSTSPSREPKFDLKVDSAVSDLEQPDGSAASTDSVDSSKKLSQPQLDGSPGSADCCSTP